MFMVFGLLNYNRNRSVNVVCSFYKI